MMGREQRSNGADGRVSDGATSPRRPGWRRSRGGPSVDGRVRIDPAPPGRIAARSSAEAVATTLGDRHREARRGAAILLAFVMIGFSVAPWLNAVTGEPANKDYDLWQQTGDLARTGADVYPKGPGIFPFMYPPACAAMLAPLSILPRALFVDSLLLINSVAWGACILLSIKLASGRAGGHWPGLYLLPSLAVIPFVHDTYLLGQPALVLLALILGAFVLLRHGRPIPAGALIAVAAAIKAYPILMVGYLVYRRQWRATAATVVTLLALMFVAPMAFRAPSQVREDFTLWARGMLFKYDENSMAQRPDRAYSFKNQSVQATVHRLARPVLANGEANKTWRVNLLDLTFRQTTWLMLGTVGGICLFYLGTSWGATRGGPPADAVDGAMVTILILMFAPLSFNYSYVWLIFPLTLLLHLGRSAPARSSLRRWCQGGIVASVGLLALALPMLKTAQAYGNVFFAGAALLLVLGVILRWGDLSLSAPEPAEIPAFAWVATRPA